PDAGRLRAPDQLFEELAPDAAPADLFGDVDARLRNAAVAAALRHGRERGPADDRTVELGDQPVLGVGRVPLLPRRRRGLEGRFARADAVFEDPRDLLRVQWREVADLHARQDRQRNPLAVVVEGELQGMRAQPHRIDLVLALPVDPRLDQALAEHVALRQERVVGLERVQRLRERTGDTLHA